MILRQRPRQETPLSWQWVLFGVLVVLFLASLLIFSLRVFAQQPAPPPALQRQSSEDRAMTIVRARELELTRLVAQYANRLEDLMEENQRLQQQLATPPPCPQPPLPASEEKATP